MKRTRLQQPATDPATAVLGGDVCRDRIDAYTELAGEGQEWSFANEPEAVEEALRRFGERARLAGKTRVLVAVESTGPCRPGRRHVLAGRTQAASRTRQGTGRPVAFPGPS